MLAWSIHGMNLEKTNGSRIFDPWVCTSFSKAAQGYRSLETGTRGRCRCVRSSLVVVLGQHSGAKESVYPLLPAWSVVLEICQNVAVDLQGNHFLGCRDSASFYDGCCSLSGSCKKSFGCIFWVERSARFRGHDVLSNGQCLRKRAPREMGVAIPQISWLQEGL